MDKLVYALLGLIAGVLITFVFVGDKCNNRETREAATEAAFTEALDKCPRSKGFGGATSSVNPQTGEITVYCYPGDGNEVTIQTGIKIPM